MAFLMVLVSGSRPFTTSFRVHLLRETQRNCSGHTINLPHKPMRNSSSFSQSAIHQFKQWKLPRIHNLYRSSNPIKQAQTWIAHSMKTKPNKFGVYILSFTMPVFFSNFKSSFKTPPSGTLSQEILANIPHEVFNKDTFKKKKQGATSSVFGWLWNKIRLWVRFVRICMTFTPILMFYPVTYVSHWLQVKWWKTLLWALEATGPTFIKLGQWASTRRDLFSSEFCDLFSRLHDDSRTHSWRMTKKRMRRAFGKRWKDIFIKLEKTPIGSGCIAQVHRGYMAPDMIPDEGLVSEVLDDMDEDQNTEVDFAEGLEIMGFHSADDDDDHSDEDHDNTSIYKSHYSSAAEDGESSVEVDRKDTLIPVAIKVLHPGVYRCVTRDLAILEMLSRVGEVLLPPLRWISLHECIQEFAVLMTNQIDLRFEAECLEQFVENFEHIPSVRFPKPVRPYCKHDVLVETFEDGEPISNFLSDDCEYPEGLRERIALSGVEALLQMVFVDNFVHGDLHPGNILVQNVSSYILPQDDNRLVLVDVGDTMVVDVQKSPDPIRLVLLDVGITSSLSVNDFGNLRDVFAAIVLGEGQRVAELMLQHARCNDCRDEEGFKRELGQVVTDCRQDAISLSKVDVGKLLSNVFSICTRYRVKMESNFASVLLAIFVLEGLGRSLDPKVDILDIAKPILLSNAMSS